MIRIFTERFLDSPDAKFFHVDNVELSNCADAQAELSLCLVHTTEGTFSDVKAKITFHCCSTNDSR